jgi:uncharacterized protein YqeY
MSLQTDIKDSIKEAMKAKDQTRLMTLRGVVSAFTNELVASNRTPQDELSDDEALAVIKRLAKQRKDAAEQYIQGGREDLAQDEQAELAVLEAFLPEMMSREKIHMIAAAKMKELEITDKSKLGLLIGAVMKETGGEADGNDVKAVVMELFDNE